MTWTKWKIFRLLWATAGISFLIWMWSSMQAKDVGKTILNSNSNIEIRETKDFISFSPISTFSKVFIFYPGALVDPMAYSPLCRSVADSGYRVFLIKMPWRLAINGYNKPKELGILTDTTKQYILAGHSQGAKMAAQFVYENPALIDKLILIGTTHPRDIDLSKVQIPVMKIYGSKDGVADMKKVNEHKSKLPLTTKYVLIEGANHSQFGYYGSQLGDDEASISREEQQQIVLANILSFIKS
jgi:hypothetical protein